MEDTREEIPVEMPPEQPFFDAIHENIDVSRVQPGKMRNAAKACSEIAEAMVEEAVTNARQNNRRDMDEMRKAFDVEAGEAKAHIEKLNKQIADMNIHIGEIQAKRDTTEEELNELRATHARLIVDNQKLWADNRELNSRVNADKSHYDNSRRALCETIETLANVIRNS